MIRLSVLAMLAPLLAVPAPAVAGPDLIEPTRWITGCAALTQPGPFAGIMDQGCARAALQYCAFGRSGPDLDACLVALHQWLEGDMKRIVSGLPDRDKEQRRTQQALFPQDFTRETCAFDPPAGASMNAYCSVVFAGTQWTQWRDKERRRKGSGN